MAVFTFRELTVCVSLFNGSAIAVQFRTVMAIHAFIALGGEVHIRLSSRGDTEISMTSPGNMACYANRNHIRGFDEIMTC